MRTMIDETTIVSLSIGTRLVDEFDRWVAATNAATAADLDTRLNRSSAIRKAMRQMMENNPAGNQENGNGE